MWVDVSCKLDQLRVQIHHDTQGLLEPLQKELNTEIATTKEMIQTVRSDNLKAFEEIRRLRSMEQQRHMLQAYPAPVEKDVLEAEFKRTNDAIQALSASMAQMSKDVTGMKAQQMDLTVNRLPTRTGSGRRMQFTPSASDKKIDRSDLDDLLQSFRETVLDIDFSGLLDGIREMIPVAPFRQALSGMEERIQEMSDELRAGHGEVQNRRAEVDFSPVIDAFARAELPRSMADILLSVEELKGQVAKDLEALPPALWAQQPAIDFAPVLACIHETRVDVDLSPVLAAVHETWTAQDALSKHFAALREELSQKDEKIDFTEVLEALRTTKMRVDFTTVLSTIEEAGETTRQAVLDGLKPPLAELSGSDAQILEVLKDKTHEQAVLAGLTGLKDQTARVSQQSSLLVQTLSDKKEEKVDVDFTPVLDAITASKVKVDFSEVLNAIRKHCDRSELSEDMRMLIKNVQEMKVQVDFTPVLRGLRETKVDTVFEVLSAIRDQRTDCGELKDILVKQSGESAALLHDLREAVQSESKEALAAQVLEAVRAREAEIDLSGVSEDLAKQKAEIEGRLSELQARLETDLKSSLDEVREALHHLEARSAADAEGIMKAASEANQPDFSEILRAIQEKNFTYDDTAVLHALDDQALGQEQMHEELKETVSSWHRHAEALKMVIRERVDSVLKTVSTNSDGAEAALRKDVTQVLEALRAFATKDDIEQQYSSLLRSIEALQLQQMESQSSKEPHELERRMSDTMEALQEQSQALQEQKDEQATLQKVLKEQMHKLKHEVLCKFQAHWDAQDKDRGAAAELQEAQLQRLKGEMGGELASGLRDDLQKLQESLLARLQSDLQTLLKDVKVSPDDSEVLETIHGQKLESLFAQVLSAIRSQPPSPSVDLTPLLTDLRETKELTQGLGYSLRSLRSEFAARPGDGASAEPAPAPAASWDFQEVLSDMLKDKLGHQTSVLQQALREVAGRVDRVDLSPILVAVANQGSEVKAALARHCGEVAAGVQSIQVKIQELPTVAQKAGAPGASQPQQVDFREVLAAIRDAGLRPGESQPPVDLAQVLQAIKEVPGQIDLSYEFSAVLTAIQEKESDKDLVPLFSAIKDSKDDLSLQLEDVKSVVRGSQGGDISRSPTRRGTTKADVGKEGDLGTILTAIKDQKVAIDFSVAQVLNNIQQKQQEAIDRMDKSDQQLEHLREGLQKLNGQETRPRSAAPQGSPCSPRSPRFHAQQWLQLPGAPWIPPGILGLDKLDRRD